MALEKRTLIHPRVSVEKLASFQDCLEPARASIPVYSKVTLGECRVKLVSCFVDSVMTQIGFHKSVLCTNPSDQ